jgi:molecular chaperone DnaK (HSP70)
VGIDLGTTNSLIAQFDGELVHVFEDDLGQPSLPSGCALRR